MKRLVIAVLLLALAGLSPLLAAVPAAADGCLPGTTPEAGPEGTICIPVTDPGDPGTSTPGEQPPGGGTTSGPGCSFNNARIPCTTAQGTWFSAQQCYAQPTDPQPPAGDPEWGGHDTAEGSVWQCVRPGIDAVWLYFFVATGAAPALVDPGELAASALGQMPLTVPSIHMAPQPPLPTYVGLETWLWIDAAQFEAITKSVTAGATTVTVTARPVRSTWRTIDGSTTCTSAGRAWVEGTPDRVATDCSFTFQHVSAGQPHGVFAMSANLTFQVDWTCNGACLNQTGTLGEVEGAAAGSAVRVTERQSVVVR